MARRYRKNFEREPALFILDTRQHSRWRLNNLLQIVIDGLRILRLARETLLLKALSGVCLYLLILTGYTETR